MRATLGELQWLVTGSRPDLAAGCSLLQQKINSSTVEDMISVNKVIALARDFSGTVLRVKSIPTRDVEFSAWSDASFANAQQLKSQEGYLICSTDRRLRNDDWAPVSPMRWRSFKQERQVSSTLGAELMSLSRTIAETKWLRSLWCEAIFSGYRLESDQVWTARIPIVIAIDSKPTYDHLHGQVMTVKDKRIAIEMLLVKRDLEKDGVGIRWLPTDHMLVDGLTKMGAPLELLRKVLHHGEMKMKEDPTVLRWIGKVPKQRKT